MSAALDTELSEEPDTGAGDQTSSRRPGGAVLGWSDLVVPLVCAAVVAADAVYLMNADLDSIVRRALQPADLWRQFLDHVKISLLITLFVLGIAVPLGALITRKRFQWLAPPALALGNIGQAAPTIGLLAIFGIAVGIGLGAVVFIIAAYSALPVLRNTIVGLQQVDEGVKDAARGMGMSPLGVLLRVETPLAIPIIGAGARTAVVLAVAVVPFGDYLGAGGLGGLLFAGIKLARYEQVILACILIAVLAMMLDWAMGIVQRMLTPRGIR